MSACERSGVVATELEAVPRSEREESSERAGGTAAGGVGEGDKSNTSIIAEGGGECKTGDGSTTTARVSEHWPNGLGDPYAGLWELCHNEDGGGGGGGGEGSGGGGEDKLRGLVQEHLQSLGITCEELTEAVVAFLLHSDTVMDRMVAAAASLPGLGPSFLANSLRNLPPSVYSPSGMSVGQICKQFQCLWEKALAAEDGGAAAEDGGVAAEDGGAAAEDGMEVIEATGSFGVEARLATVASRA